MQGNVILRWLAVPVLAALAACSNSSGTAAGQTPAPSQTTMAQSNSTAAPMQSQSKNPGSKIFARTYALNGVQFEVWANGMPVATIQWPDKSVDITAKMRGHANRMAIKWTKLNKNGTGTLSITSDTGTKLMTAVVTKASPRSAGTTHTIIVPAAPTGSSSTSQ